MAGGLPLRVPTLLKAGAHLHQEVCYLTLPYKPSVAELIAEKIRAELRKVRLGASADTTIAPLIGSTSEAVARAGSPVIEERLAILRGWDAFKDGQLSVMVDGLLATRLEQQLDLHRNSVILFFPRLIVATC